jgi:FkbM family methyltransferase
LLHAAVNRDGTRTEVGRGYAFKLLSRLTPVAAVDADGIRYLVETSDRSIGRETYIHRGYDVDVMDRIIRLTEDLVDVRPLLEGRTFVDVGANIGTTTIPAVIRYGAAEVVAFEPVPATFVLLQCNLIVNALAERVRAIPVALSDESGAALMELSGNSLGDSRVRTQELSDEQNLLGEGGWATTRVRTQRFDELYEQLGIDLERVAMLWIDTQGHEAHVLAGASSILERGIPLVLEYWPYGLRRARSLDRLHDLLARSYRTFVDARADEPLPMPIAALGDLAPRYPTPADYTDLIVIK